MAYTNEITSVDLSGGVADVRVMAGYTGSVIGAPNGPTEFKQEEVDFLDIPASTFAGPNTFSYIRDLAPPPSPAWFIALWIQEIPRIASDTGWLFRSGRFTTEPPADPIEIILASARLIGDSELAASVAVPVTSQDTTITAVSLAITGQDIALVAVGTDTRLSAGSTFTYSATMVLTPNGSLHDLDSPVEISLLHPSLSFSAGPGAGFTTSFLNLISGIIETDIAPQVKQTIKGNLNSGILAQVATSLNSGVPSAMPAGVILSIRSIRAVTRPAAMGGGTEPAIEFRGALGAFGGVISKFPALASGSSGSCFIATAATAPNSSEVVILREWRDRWLRPRRGGASLISAYERFSPPLALRIAKSSRSRAIVRRLLIEPAARLAKVILGDVGSKP